jgi:carnitine 3-dehydrogenase
VTRIKSAAVIGAGVIGSGWIARLLLNGMDVDVFDPSDEAPQNVNKVIENAERAYKKLLTLDLPKRGSLVFKNSVVEASKSADIIIEAVPERLLVKQAVYKEIEHSAKSNAIIASSTSGILPTELQAEMSSPDRLIVAHPFNPVYLLPLVELVGGSKHPMSRLKMPSVFLPKLVCSLYMSKRRSRRLLPTGFSSRFGARRFG